MTNNLINPKVNGFMNRATKWHDEFVKLREILLECQLTEELKWGQPCYTLEGSNIVLIHGFKEYCALLFMKGVLLKDPKGILIQQTANVQAARQIRFTNLAEIVALETDIKATVKDAIEVERAGLEVTFKEHTEYQVPEELTLKFYSNPILKAAFEALTPGRQRAYLFYFAQPKHTKTREDRIEKVVQQILDGKGLND
ncbi:MAG: hypothetical protein FD133_750 [Erysipelotrichaceae bacterium]|nr:MAG: hypothetical protein FD179_1192 [Erysipelotrichaceae bacterium]TXT18591.1 MAG: hypothetical protein FD133_750 [Erysipelotrichaceae bacterium]